MENNKFKIAITECKTYNSQDLTTQLIEKLFKAAEIPPPSKTSVLVKPNLLAPDPLLAVTNPILIEKVCRFLLDHDNRVMVGDSPAFSSPIKIAEKIGLNNLLKSISVEVKELNEPVSKKLGTGVTIGISRKALEAEYIVNIPKMKAHCQMGITGGVKNMFGVVTGFRKALVHYRYGDSKNLFSSIIVDIAESLAPSCNILDAVTAMHITGPKDGKPYHLNMLAASSTPFALDTALYETLNLASGDKRFSIRNEAIRRSRPDALGENMLYTIREPDHFDTDSFQLPQILTPETFNPIKLFKGRVKSLLMRTGMIG